MTRDQFEALVLLGGAAIIGLWALTGVGFFVVMVLEVLHG
jgi:hypothetical protein